MTDVQKALFKLQDKKYKQFSASLMPTVDPDTVIGVRVPLIRKLAKELRGNADAFLLSLPHEYFEENNLHAFIISENSDFDECIAAVERFLPYVDNWATCDGLRPKCFAKNKSLLLKHIQNWLRSDKPYTVRFGIEMLMLHYLDRDFDPHMLEQVSLIRSDEYYVNMMIAWYFATALAKQWDRAVIYLQEKRLPAWVHSKTIQKATESYRLSAEQKKYLKTLKVGLRQ